MDDQKQHVIDTLKGANNILVTVRNSPSIDQLAACIALTLVLNELGKHGTAVFSGHVPSVLEFLEPEKTIERNTDSLQDFIISLDKAKADKLRYKIEDTVVKIFITPYRTSISDKDLEFGQGDFNVDVVVALGVHNQDDLDEAITAHGKILHDATVISVNLDSGASEELGSISWVDPEVSSLSEMVANLAGQLGKEDVIDNQVATALLTGIVAETERFGNVKTKPSTMEVAAKLLAAGANQELVATKLAEPERPETPSDNGGQGGSSEYIEPLAQKEDAGTLEIEHTAGEVPAEAQPSSGFAQEGADFEVPQENPDENSGQDGQADGQPGGEVPPVYHPPEQSSPFYEQPPEQQAPQPDTGGGQPAGEEQQALDYLKGRRVDLSGRRARIEPLRDQGEYLGGEPGPAAGTTEGGKPLDGTKFALTPPSMGGTLTANMPQDNAPSLESQTHAPEASPILSHEAPGVITPDKLAEPADAQPHAREAEPQATVKPEASAEPQAPATEEQPRLQTLLAQAADREAKPEAPKPAAEPAEKKLPSAVPEAGASDEGLIAPAFDIQSHAVAGPAEPAPAVKPGPNQTLADLEKEVHAHTDTPEATDMPKPAAPTVNLPSPQSPSAQPANASAAPPPPVPPPMPNMAG